MNGFTWLLISFPVYLLAKRRLTNYFGLASGKTVGGEVAQTGKGGTSNPGGLNNNQAVV